MIDIHCLPIYILNRSVFALFAIISLSKNLGKNVVLLISATANNYSPWFSVDAFDFDMSYYAASGTEIAAAGIISATDEDSGADGTVTYAIDQSMLAPNQDYFSVQYQFHSELLERFTVDFVHELVLFLHTFSYSHIVSSIRSISI